MKTLGICVGHSRKGDSGASNTRGVSEHRFNTELANLTAGLLKDSGFPVHVISHYEGSGYGASMRWLADHLRDLGVMVAVELHFNSAGPFAHGHEWLHWHRSTQGQRLASCFNTSFKEVFPEARARGVKPLDASDRGSLFVRYTRCPAIILEPFFGSNKDETEFYSDRMHSLAEIYANALTNYCS